MLNDLILIVDDEVSFTDPLKVLLRDICDDVHVAPDYERALELLGKHEYFLVICDINLGDPSYDGYTLYKSVADQVEGNPHWLFMSGDPEKARGVRGFKNSTFMEKATSTELLIYTARQTLNMKQLLDSASSSSSIATEDLVSELKDTFLTTSVFGKSMKSVKDMIKEGFENNSTELQNVLDTVEGLDERLLKLEKDYTDLDKKVNENTGPSWKLFGKWFTFLVDNKILAAVVPTVLGLLFYYLQAL